MNQKDFFSGYAKGTLKSNARLGNVYIDGAVIYSYGSHFPLATLERMARVAHVNKDKYSQSTSKQQGYLRNALTQAGYTLTYHDTNSLKGMI